MSYFYKEKVMIHKKAHCAMPAQFPITQKKRQKMEEKPNVRERRETMLGQIHIPAVSALLHVCSLVVGRIKIVTRSWFRGNGSSASSF